MRRTRARSRAARNGVLISTGDGEAVAYALWYLEERGKLFVIPGTKVYQGMIIGEHAPRQRSRRQSAEGQTAHQHPHDLARTKRCGSRPSCRMTLEQSIAYIEDDELVEVTPQSIRLRKRELLPHLRKRAKAESLAG